jgi:hypothetical protein
LFLSREEDMHESRLALFKHGVTLCLKWASTHVRYILQIIKPATNVCSNNSYLITERMIPFDSPCSPDLPPLPANLLPHPTVRRSRFGLLHLELCKLYHGFQLYFVFKHCQ